MRFNDTTGRTWHWKINVGTLAQCKKETGVDLAKSIEKGSTVLQDLLDDVALFFDVMCSLLKSQMKDAGVTAEQLGEAINDEDAVIEASRSLIEAIIDFFPKGRSMPLKKAFARLWTLTKEKATIEAEKAATVIESLDLEAMADGIVESMKPEKSKTLGD